MDQYLCLTSPDQFAAPPVRLADGIFRVKFKTSLLAAKVVDLEDVSDDEVGNLVEGVHLCRSLSHRNILSLLTAFVHRSSLWFLSPYCDLLSAGDLCQPFGLSELQIALVTRDVLHGLDYLHKKGVIHRAVCGSHILVKSEGRCLLTGLNYSTSVISNGVWKTALHNFPTGGKKNLIFLAPEVLEQNLLGYNYKSDIYSLGVTCCELANGIIPYWNLEPAEMLLDKLTGNHARPIDKTCAQYIEVREEDLTVENKQRYDVYRNRQFSESFHTFCVSLCLMADPHKRPSAQQLLNHRFLKQLKKIPAKHLLSSLRRQVTSRETSSGQESVLSEKKRATDTTDVEWSF